MKGDRYSSVTIANEKERRRIKHKMAQYNDPVLVLVESDLVNQGYLPTEAIQEAWTNNYEKGIGKAQEKGWDVVILEGQ